MDQLPVPAGDGIDLAAISRRAVHDSGGDAARLGGYLDTVVAAAHTGRRLARYELDNVRALGVAAAERGTPLGAVVDLYLEGHLAGLAGTAQRPQRRPGQ